MAQAKRDDNYIPTLLAVSSVDGETPVILYANPTTHRLLVASTPATLDDISDVVITAGAQGDVLYNNGTNWVNLAAGTNGKYLKTQGAGADPIWDTPSTGAPTDAKYWVSTSNETLSAEANIGALTTGILKITVAAGEATPSTAIADTDYLMPATAALTYAPITTTVVGTASSTDNAIVRFDGTNGKLIQNSLALIDDNGYLTFPSQINVSGTWTQIQATGVADLNFKTVVGTKSVIFTADVTDTLVINTTNIDAKTKPIVNVTDPTNAQDAATKNYADSASTIYHPSGTDVAIGDGGTGASLTDPNADRIMFWDDTAGAVTWLTAGSGLTITDTTITATATGGGFQATLLDSSNVVLPNTNFAAPGRTVGTNIVYSTLDFDQTTSESAYWSIPLSYTPTTSATLDIIWTAAAGSGTVTWDVDWRSVSNGETLDATTTPSVTNDTVTDTLLATGSAHYIQLTFTSSTATMVAGDLLQIKISRDVSDTLTADAKLIGALLKIT